MTRAIASAYSAIVNCAAVGLLVLSCAVAQAQSVFPLLPPSVSTIAFNGDLNPYGVVITPKNLPAGAGLQAGDMLVSNFNNSNNLQGTGSTIVRISHTNGAATTFFASASPRNGLTAAIGILSNGIVLVGNLPTADGTPATVGPGALSVLDRAGDFLGTFGTVQTVNGPWGMAVYDTGNGVTGTAHVFLSNVLSGVISRFDVSYTAGSIDAGVTIIGTGFNHRLDPAALVLGPSGLAFDAVHDVLYIASSSDNAIYTISGAASATSAVSPVLFLSDSVHLHGPIDLTFLPNGHLIVANSDGSNADPTQPSELVEYSANGTFVGEMSVDPNNGGAFGVVTSNLGWGTFRLAAVDDNTNTLNIWTSVIP